MKHLPPPDCGVCTENMECLGCGLKMSFMQDGYCGHVEHMKRKDKEKEETERKEYERLKLKYEGK